RHDAREIGTLLRDHPLADRLAGNTMSRIYTFLVVEIDPPFSDSIYEKHGESFRPWSEEDFSATLTSLCTDLPYSAFTVCLSPDTTFLHVLFLNLCTNIPIKYFRYTRV